MGSIPLGANNFFSPKKCACHLCDKVLTFYYVLQKFSWLLARTHTIMNNSMSAQTVTLWNVWQNVPPRPGIEPGPSTWQAEILTTRLSRNWYWRRHVWRYKTFHIESGSCQGLMTVHWLKSTVKLFQDQRESTYSSSYVLRLCGT